MFTAEFMKKLHQRHLDDGDVKIGYRVEVYRQRLHLTECVEEGEQLLEEKTFAAWPRTEESLRKASTLASHYHWLALQFHAGTENLDLSYKAPCQWPTVDFEDTLHETHPDDDGYYFQYVASVEPVWRAKKTK